MKIFNKYYFSSISRHWCNGETLFIEDVPDIEETLVEVWNIRLNSSVEVVGVHECLINLVNLQGHFNILVLGCSVGESGVSGFTLLMSGSSGTVYGGEVVGSSIIAASPIQVRSCWCWFTKNVPLQSNLSFPGCVGHLLRWSQKTTSEGVGQLLRWRPERQKTRGLVVCPPTFVRWRR